MYVCFYNNPVCMYMHVHYTNNSGHNGQIRKSSRDTAATSLADEPIEHARIPAVVYPLRNNFQIWPLVSIVVVKLLISYRNNSVASLTW